MKHHRAGIILLATFCLSLCDARGTQSTQWVVPFVSDSASGTILIQAKLNGSPATMVLDTGATRTIFDVFVTAMSAAQLKLELSQMNSNGVGLDTKIIWRFGDIQISGHQWIQHPVQIADLRNLSRVYGRRIDGILGQDLLRTFTSVQINYKCHCIIFDQN